MKTLQQLAKRLDLGTGTDYFEYMIDSYINGNMSQCKELFNDMRREDILY